VRNLPTYYGNLTYSMRMEGEGIMRLNLDGDLSLPPGGFVVLPPLPRPIRQVTINARALGDFEPDRFTCMECPAKVIVRF
jgi:hypothetical protein